MGRRTRPRRCRCRCTCRPGGPGHRCCATSRSTCRAPPACCGLLNFGVFTSGSPLYQTLNFLGATGFTYTAISPFNPGLFITEAVWALVALYGLWKIWSKPKHNTHDGSPTPTPA
ncbi:CBU_0592 family membrane protein [Ornithinimicrobium sufpigmenti]|uniref:CBU_0592 family membrane protein n=1 Tax=Ornithinimicrobium sufpigmenti TaxID=2508882 RepID=UPI003CE450A8